MIVQIRGTGGSGKTTVMRAVMEPFKPWEPHYIEGRRKPYYYTHGGLSVVGHYESVCGGCDNIGSAPKCYEALQTVKNKLVLAEGMLLSEDVKWTLQLDDEVRAYFLPYTLETCLDRIRRRRREAGNDKPLSTKLTTQRYYTVNRAYIRLKKAGVWVKRCGTERMIQEILELCHAKV